MSSQTSSSAKSSSKSSSKSKSGSKSKPPRSSLESGSTPVFTPRMQDAQARNRDSYYDSCSDDSLWEGPGSRFDAYGNDSYTNTQLRRQAAIILDSPELLMMHAQARNDSIPGTRHYFTKQLCGYLDEKDKDPIPNPPPEKMSDKLRQKSNKGKEPNAPNNTF